MLENIRGIVLPGIYMDTGYMVADAPLDRNQLLSVLYIRGPTCSYTFLFMMFNELRTTYDVPASDYTTKVVPDKEISCIELAIKDGISKAELLAGDANDVSLDFGGT